VTAWQWLAGHQAFEVGQAGARRVMRRLADQDAAGYEKVIGFLGPNGAGRRPWRARRRGIDSVAC
jgi:hypothetical protein